MESARCGHRSPDVLQISATQQLTTSPPQLACNPSLARRPTRVLDWLCFRHFAPDSESEELSKPPVPRESREVYRASAESARIVSPFETALRTKMSPIPTPAEAPVLFTAALSDELVSPFDSARSCGEVARAASQSMSSALYARRPSLRCSSSSFENAVGPARAAKPLGKMGSAPQAPKTPRRSGEFPFFSMDPKPMDMGSLDPTWTQAGKNPIRGHPRFRRLGELRTPDTCGSGGGALTLLARDEDTAQLVTIKLLRRGSADVDNAANEILNMRACAAHPFIVRFKQAFLTPDYLAIAMEHTHSGSLQDYITSNSQGHLGMGGLDEGVARSFLQQLIVALDFCHEMGIAHRDIRPENMLLMGANDGPSRRNSRAGDDVVGGLGRRGFPRLKLYGFHRSSSAGLDGSNGSSQAGALTTSSVPDASEASPYTAPEAGAEHDSKAADVWACGVLLHHMLTGSLPQLDGRDYVPPPRMAAECRRLLCSMLRADPAKRASIFEIMQSPWFLRDCPEGLEDVDTELIIMAEEGMLRGCCEQSEVELQALVQKATSLDSSPSSCAVVGLQQQRSAVSVQP